jgi:hypothetical protein
MAGVGGGNKSFLAQAWFGLCLLQLSVFYFLFKLSCRHGCLAEGRRLKKDMEMLFQEICYLGPQSKNCS